MSAKRFLFSGSTILILALCFARICIAQKKSPCVSSACGDTQISYPFRLKTDPENCGHWDPVFALECQNNRTILTSESKKYRVHAINYTDFSIRLADPGLDRQNYSSCPIYSSQDYISSAYMYFSSIRSIDILFYNCVRPVNNTRFIENMFCGNKKAFSNSSRVYSYFIVHDMSVSDTKEPCTFGRVAQGSSDMSVADITTYQAVHDVLSNGFEYIWYRAHSLCKDCAADKGTCILQDYQISCSHICYEDTPLSELSFRCKMEYYAPWIIFIGLCVIGGIVGLRLLIGFPFLLGLVVHKWRRQHLLLEGSSNQAKKLSTALQSPMFHA